MNTKCNLIVREATKGYSNKLREYFQSKGFSTHIVFNLTEIPEKIKLLSHPILIIELPDDKIQSDFDIQAIKAMPEAFPFPLIAIGKYAQENEKSLDSLFALSTTMAKTVSNPDLFEAVQYISEAFKFPSERVDSQAIVSPFVSESTSKSAGKLIAPPVTVITELPETIPVHELYASFRSIPDLFFNELEKSNLLKVDLRGREYTLIMSKSAIKDQSYLPTDEKILGIINSMEEKLSRHCAVRIHRMAYLSHTLIKALCSNNSFIEAARSAAFLYNWSLVFEQKGLLKKDYLNKRSRLVRKDVASRVKDSAMKAMIDLKIPTVGEIIARVGRFIGREEAGSDDDISMIASAIAAVDLIDRACWQSNHFNPRAAYKIMTTAKSGGLSDFHPAILCSIVKILSEAISANTKVLLVPRRLRKDPALMAAYRANREQAVSAGERKVEISDLEPGMRLSRPLVAYDGKQILGEDLILDQDLIWRIWQLSLVRALNAPLIISRA